MDKFELQLKQDEKTVNDFAEKIELVSYTNFVKKEELLEKLIGRDVVKTKQQMLLTNCSYNLKKN